MSWISPEDAYLIFDKWREEQSPLQLVMKRPPGLRAVNSTFVKSVLPQSHQVLIAALVDGEYLNVAVSLEGVEYEYDDASAVLPEFAGGKWVCFLAVHRGDDLWAAGCLEAALALAEIVSRMVEGEMDAPLPPQPVQNRPVSGAPVPPPQHTQDRRVSGAPVAPLPRDERPECCAGLARSGQ